VKVVEQMSLPLDGFTNVKDFSKSGKICGVYILFYGNRVIYVGQSVDVQQRVVAHKLEKPYTRCLVKEMPEQMLHETEKALIAVLQPPLNKAGVYEENRESEYAHRLVALADLVGRVARSNGWHDLAKMDEAQSIIRKQAVRVAQKYAARGGRP
jgi:hypothetical protein